MRIERASALGRIRLAQPDGRIGCRNGHDLDIEAARSRASVCDRLYYLQHRTPTAFLPTHLRYRHHQALIRETQSRYGNARLILAAARGMPAESRRRRQSPTSNAQAIEIGPSCRTNL